jgi:hypothetical protein
MLGFFFQSLVYESDRITEYPTRFRPDNDTTFQNRSGPTLLSSGEFGGADLFARSLRLSPSLRLCQSVHLSRLAIIVSFHFLLEALNLGFQPCSTLASSSPSISTGQIGIIFIHFSPNSFAFYT